MDLASKCGNKEEWEHLLLKVMGIYLRGINTSIVFRLATAGVV